MIVRRLRLHVLLPLVLGLTLAACSRGVGDSSIVEPSEVVTAVEDGAVLVDVRTPAEFAAGHLDGALNIDLQSPDFEERIGALDKSEKYVVYCRSGNRSRTAAEVMFDKGFDDVVNGGGYDALSAAGIG